jgi:hypothetical protein
MCRNSPCTAVNVPEGVSIGIQVQGDTNSVTGHTPQHSKALHHRVYHLVIQNEP